jgi:hypothetical protein
MPAFEIYNEEVSDLLTKDNQVLQIREDPAPGSLCAVGRERRI